MVLSFVYLAFRAPLGRLFEAAATLDMNDVKLLVLRHQPDALHRRVARPKLGVVNPALLAAAGMHPRLSSRARASLFTRKAVPLGAAFP